MPCSRSWPALPTTMMTINEQLREQLKKVVRKKRRGTAGLPWCVESGKQDQGAQRAARKEGAARATQGNLGRHCAEGRRRRPPRGGRQTGRRSARQRHLGHGGPAAPGRLGRDLLTADLEQIAATVQQKRRHG